MPNTSAGILLYRRGASGPEVLLVHPGGPFWSRRDEGAWMIPKGEVGLDEDSRAAALREFGEELGSVPAGKPEALCKLRQKGGKWVEAFVLEGDFNPERLVSNAFTIEYPLGSGELRSFPEVDRVAWFELDLARAYMLPSQLPVLDAFEAWLAPR